LPDVLTHVLQQFDFAVRLLLAAILGGAIGVEREIHDHPAGIRTHMLVSLGSAIFTLLGIIGFSQVQGASGVVAPVDPTRIAAQVVSGIGFLGAGAIIKYGTTVRGLTTAASLWATASIGMAAAAGAWLVASVGTVIMIASLWPLARIVARVRSVDGRSLRLQLAFHDLADLNPVMADIHRRRLDITAMETDKVGKGQYEVMLQLSLPAGAVRTEIIESIGKLHGVVVLQVD
jgi:putative Mg2+ transporter-C (MgtC) family protein